MINLDDFLRVQPIALGPPDDPDAVWEWARARALIADELDEEVVA